MVQDLVTGCGAHIDVLGWRLSGPSSQAQAGCHVRSSLARDSRSVFVVAEEQQRVVEQASTHPGLDIELHILTTHRHTALPRPPECSQHVGGSKGEVFISLPN